MAPRFWVGGTGTWDASDQTHWSSTTGPGNAPQTVPGSGDTVTFDANSGGGTVTVNTTVTVQSITMGAFTGTLDFATNDNNVTLSTNFSGSGTGTRTLNMGDGTWTFTITGGANVWDMTTTTNLTFNANASTMLLSAVPTAQRGFQGGGLTYNNLTVTNAAASARPINMAGSNTFANITFTNVRYVTLTSATTTTISGTFTFDGSSTSVGMMAATAASATISVANATTLNWVSLGGITKAGAGSITANNSFDAGNNSGITINAPAAGGGAHIIGG